MIQEAYIGDYRHTRDPKVWKNKMENMPWLLGVK